MNTAGSLLSKLIDKELGSVVFVRDYLQLDFDGPRLSVFVWPHIAADGCVLRMGDPGYRDGLCDLIGHPVRSATEDSTAGLRRC